MLQQIPDHVGIMGNECTDYLVKKRTTTKTKTTKLEPHIQKDNMKCNFIHQSLVEKQNSQRNIKDKTDLLNMPRKTAMALV